MEDMLRTKLLNQYLRKNCVYEDFTGKKWVYFGKTVINYKKQVKISKGLGFVRYYDGYIPSVRVTIIKSAKKLKSKVNGLKIELKEEYTGKHSFSFMEGSETLKLLP